MIGWIRGGCVGATGRSSLQADARSRGPDRCACQNRRWYFLGPRRSYDAYCYKVLFLGTYEGLAFWFTFLCGTPRIADEGGFFPPDFGGAHRSGPRLHLQFYAYYFEDTTLDTISILNHPGLGGKSMIGCLRRDCVGGIGEGPRGCIPPLAGHNEAVVLSSVRV
jgi:hypothetical protein